MKKRRENKSAWELYKNFYSAEKAYSAGRLKEAKKFYEKILQIGKVLYTEAEHYVRERIRLEEKIKEYISYH